MHLLEHSDQAILDIANPMIDDIINGSNQKDWALFSKYQRPEEANDPNNRANVERQWQENAFLTSLSLEREILGILRRESTVQIVWKQKSTQVYGDFLAILYLSQIGDDIKEIGFLIQ